MDPCKFTHSHACKDICLTWLAWHDSKGFTHASMHACIHALMHPCTHASMHSIIHPCTHDHSCIHALMHPCIHALMHSCTHAFMHACMTSFDLCTYQPDCSHHASRIRSKSGCRGPAWRSRHGASNSPSTACRPDGTCQRQSCSSRVENLFTMWGKAGMCLSSLASCTISWNTSMWMQISRCLFGPAMS